MKNFHYEKKYCKLNLRVFSTLKGVLNQLLNCLCFTKT